MNKKVPFIDNSRQSPLWVARDDKQMFISDITRRSWSVARNDIRGNYATVSWYEKTRLLLDFMEMG
jgi:hypothetical protein